MHQKGMNFRIYGTDDRVSPSLSLSLPPPSPPADGHCKKGLLFFEEKKVWEAKAMFKKAIELNYDNMVWRLPFTIIMFIS